MEQRQVGPIHRWGSRLLNVTAAVVCACLAVEVILRAAELYAPPDIPIRTARPDLYHADPHVGYRLWTSSRVTYRYPPTSSQLIALVSNSDGFRNRREFDEPDDRTRILVVGDSFIFGDGVRDEERITEKLETLEPNWRVDNMGMTGWGVDLMIRALEHYGRKADPDVVVLAIYTDNLRRLVPYYAGAGFAYPKFALVGSELVTIPYPYPRGWQRLRLAQAAYQSRWGARHDRDVGWLRKNRNRYDLHEALLNRYLEKGKTAGFEPLVMFLPGRGDTEEDQERRGFLQKWTAEHEVRYLDLTRAIHGAGVDNVYIPGNWHWNAMG